jgi:hypothetical protein
LLGAAPVCVSSRFGAAVSMLTCFALRWRRRAPGPAIWMFALKSCQLGLSAARDASFLAAILRRASLTASALAAPAAQHWSWLRQWPELSVHCFAVAPGRSACPRICGYIGCAYLCYNLAPRRVWLFCDCRRLSHGVAVDMLRGPVWESVQPAGFHAIKPGSARSRFAACVPLAFHVDTINPRAVCSTNRELCAHPPRAVCSYKCELCAHQPRAVCSTNRELCAHPTASCVLNQPRAVCSSNRELCAHPTASCVLNQPRAVCSTNRELCAHLTASCVLIQVFGPPELRSLSCVPTGCKTPQFTAEPRPELRSLSCVH